MKGPDLINLALSALGILLINKELPSCGGVKVSIKSILFIF